MPYCRVQLAGEWGTLVRRRTDHAARRKSSIPTAWAGNAARVMCWHEVPEA